MKKILILSDTHGYCDDAMLRHAAASDEVWHGGDWGNYEVAEKLMKVAPVVRGVYGNIDGTEVRAVYKEFLNFTCEEVKVLMTHIAGRPPKYNASVLSRIRSDRPNIFICGHSHILSVLPDKENNLLFINPGAAGIYGFHKVRTMLRLEIDGQQVKNAAVIELGKRG